MKKAIRIILGVLKVLVELHNTATNGKRPGHDCQCCNQKETDKTTSDNSVSNKD